jgi:hypothetical protein
MTPQVNVSQSLFEKIKALAEPFVDTPESVITRCVDFYTDNHRAAKPISAQVENGEASAIVFPGDAPPSLTFTRLLSIKLDGKRYDKKDLYWNALMFDVVAKAAAKLKSKDKLKQIILVNYVEGQGAHEKGYRLIPEAGLSVQGQAANAAWQATFHIIKAIGMNIDLVFMWENKDKAAYPGKTGRMTHKAV